MRRSHYRGKYNTTPCGTRRQALMRRAGVRNATSARTGTARTTQRKHGTHTASSSDRSKTTRHRVLPYGVRSRRDACSMQQNRPWRPRLRINFCFCSVISRLLLLLFASPGRSSPSEKSYCPRRCLLVISPPTTERRRVRQGEKNRKHDDEYITRSTLRDILSSGRLPS